MRSIAIKFFLVCCAALPFRLAHIIGAIIGRGLTLIPNSTRHIATTNVKLCFPDMDKTSHQRLLQKSLIETGKTAVEMGALWYWRKERVVALVKKVSGEDVLDQALENGRGVILAMPHLGSWEMIGLYCSAKYPMTTMYRLPRIASLDSTLRNARQRFGANLVTASTSGIRALHKALAKGELIAMLPDQEPSKGSGVFTPFFGIPAYTMTLLPKLARSSGSTVIFAFAERLSKGAGYHIYFMAAADDIKNETKAIATLAMNKEIERFVHMKPEQYQWNYKRFRTRPDGEPDIY